MGVATEIGQVCSRGRSQKSEKQGWYSIDVSNINGLSPQTNYSSTKSLVSHKSPKLILGRELLSL
jgi:hypothetical protein